MMTVNVQIDYYAVLREKRGLRTENRTVSAATLKELYNQLAQQFDFALPLERVKVAVADRFCSWDQPIKDGDRIVFIPPVAGG